MSVINPNLGRLFGDSFWGGSGGGGGGGRRLTKNPEIGNTPIWVFPNIWRLGRWDTKFYMNVSNKMLLNAAKCQDYCFYHFWIVKGKPTGGKITPYPPSQTHTLRLGLIKSKLKVIQIIGQRAGNSCRHRHFCNA